MRHCVQILLICPVLLLALSCKEQGEADVRLLEELRHTNGLTVRRPDGFRATEQTGGFAFQEEGMIRYPRFLRVVRLEQAPARVPTGSRELRSGATASYAIEKRSGGMGGDEYELIVWRSIDGIWILVSETVQVEFGEPGFPVAWALINQAWIAKSKG
jgi:hypothetical protein